jgi:hypothetical protein
VLETIAGRLPPDDAALRTRFERLAALVRARDAALRVALEAALSALLARGVEVCPLKGPVLADRIHPDPALRPAGDLDLLVAEDRLEGALSALEADGYRREEGFRAQYERRHAHHVTLLHPERPPVELHFRLQSGFGATLSAEDALARARPYRTGSGRSVRVLAPEDELILLAVHAAHHLIERRGWLLDLLLLLDAHPGLDWALVAERARAGRCRRPVAYVLLQLRRLGAAVPDALLQAVDPARLRLAEALRRAALGRARRDRTDHALRLAFEALMCDGPLLAGGRLAHEAEWFVRRRVHRRTSPP